MCGCKLKARPVNTVSVLLRKRQPLGQRQKVGDDLLLTRVGVLLGECKEGREDDIRGHCSRVLEG